MNKTNKKNANDELGTLFPKDQYFISVSVGKYEDAKRGIRLSLGSIVNSNEMCVLCFETGKTYVIEWNKVIELAIAAGIGDEDE